jgi:PadR family transcriptional regulator AphA
MVRKERNIVARAGTRPVPDAADDLPSTHALAVLALLAVAPMTAYAIAEQNRRTLGMIWSASRRLLFGEPKRLAARGLVEPVEARAGSRAAQEWRVTGVGRAALRRWLDSPVAPTVVSSELVLRLFFADHGDLEMLHRQVRLRRQQLEDEMRASLAVLDDLLTRGGNFPHRLHLTTASGRFIGEIKYAEYAFLGWLDDELTTWTDTVTPDPERQRRELLAMRARLVESLGGAAGA